ncbi:MIF4G domain-containing protein, partial [Reticulomyxa filosa]
NNGINHHNNKIDNNNNNNNNNDNNDNINNNNNNNNNNHSNGHDHLPASDGRHLSIHRRRLEPPPKHSGSQGYAETCEDDESMLDCNCGDIETEAGAYTAKLNHVPAKKNPHSRHVVIVIPRPPCQALLNGLLNIPQIGIVLIMVITIMMMMKMKMIMKMMTI